MSGHNKWSKIKHKKGAADAKRSKLFSILSRQITIEARGCGGDKSHPALRKAIERAKAANIPNDNIERAVARATSTEASSLEEVRYEAYGPGGVAMLIEGITDNTNRTSQEIKHLLSEHGGSLATPGAAIWAFTKVDAETGSSWQANAPIPLSESEKEKVLNLITTLEEHDDVKNVYDNSA
ncbi:MAG: YebC/PmpR family DNA-binding transcriptional regulator [Patescibacteria group bacterium]|nr:YebC/PmpR family DNA-binding transcriptional regulator [Patescibacteria group bacterium]